MTLTLEKPTDLIPLELGQEHLNGHSAEALKPEKYYQIVLFPQIDLEITALPEEAVVEPFYGWRRDFGEESNTVNLSIANPEAVARLNRAHSQGANPMLSCAHCLRNLPKSAEYQNVALFPEIVGFGAEDQAEEPKIPIPLLSYPFNPDLQQLAAHAFIGRTLTAITPRFTIGLDSCEED